MAYNIRIKRAYDKPDKNDGFRILIDRLWPRGVSKDEADLDEWVKEIAPSDHLRKWYDHDVDKWPEFKKKYIKELQENNEVLDKLRGLIDEHEVVTFIYAAKDEDHNNAVVLRDFLT